MSSQMERPDIQESNTVAQPKTWWDWVKDNKFIILLILILIAGGYWYYTKKRGNHSIDLFSENTPRGMVIGTSN